MAGKGRGYHGHSREHGLHRKGISTKIDEHRRFDVSKFVARGNDENKRGLQASGYEWMASVPDSIEFEHPTTKESQRIHVRDNVYNEISFQDMIEYLENDSDFHNNTTKEQMKISLRKMLVFQQGILRDDFNFYVDHVMPKFLKTEFMLHSKYKKGLIGSGVEKLTISDARKINKEHDKHFFDRETMKFFKGIIHTRGTLLKGQFFIDSTQFDENPRNYHVRKFDKESGRVETVKKDFSSLEQARAYARDL